MCLFQGVVLLLVGILLMAGGIIKMRNASRALDEMCKKETVWCSSDQNRGIAAPGECDPQPYSCRWFP